MTGLPLRCSMVSIVVLQGGEASPRILLLRRDQSYMQGVWSYVAGHIEPGEAGWQTALRELAEETGLVPDTLYTTSFCEQFYDARANCVQIVPAFVAFVPSDVTVALNDEHSAFSWVAIEQAMQGLPFGSQRDLLVHVRREFIERTPAPILQVPLP